MGAEDNFGTLLKETREVESFFHDFISQMTKRHPKPGEDVTRYAGELGLKIPAALKGTPFVWGGAETEATAERKPAQTLVFMRPGNPEAIGLTLGCVRWGHFQICIDCGWLYCRIVIKGNF